MSDFVVSLIRTWTPIVAGALCTWLAGVLGVNIDSAQLAVILTSVLSGLWYALARFLETKNPKFGVLLGKAKQPVYVAPPVVTAVP